MIRRRLRVAVVALPCLLIGAVAGAVAGFVDGAERAWCVLANAWSRP